MFVEAKSLHDCPNTSLFERHRNQVMGYIQKYRLNPEVTKMDWDRPIAWILLTNFAQLHFIRVNETTPTFSFKLADLWARRNELWELLALENLDANRIDEVYDQQKKAVLDQQFLADLKKWRLLIANGFALRQQERPLEEITLASQQLLDRFIFCRMLETRRLVEYNKLARAYNTYWALFARADKNFSESCANRFSSKSRTISTPSYSSSRCFATISQSTMPHSRPSSATSHSRPSWPPPADLKSGKAN
jgi:hypothetical protein